MGEPLEVALLMAAIFLPGLNTLLKTASPGVEGWMVIMGMSLISLIILQILKNRNLRLF